MSFTWPLALVGLLAVPLVGLVYLLSDRRRRRQAARFGTPALVAGFVSQRPGGRRHLPFLLALVALAALVVGLARPTAVFSEPREEATVVLTMDTSRSMAATDVTPSRLAAARAAANTFLEELPEKYRVAIVSFATGAQVVLTPTDDRDAARGALAQLRLGAGTAMGDGIVRSVAVVRRGVDLTSNRPNLNARPSPDDPPATIVLLSDGAQTSGDRTPAQAAQLARSLEVPVTTIAFGTSPSVVQVPLPGGLRQQVTVTPDPATLRTVAQRTGGKYYEALDARRLEEIYGELGSRLGEEPKRREVTYAFAAAGGLLMLVGAALSSIWFRRPL
ncbi:MAG TPA: VWA domain-containing protein [Gaiella sp.]|jgi:Ca-activated chloride channel family protein